jgi:hypothetical protein
MPLSAAGQSPAFEVKSEVTVRQDSFACKDRSELDRLLQRNRSGEFTSGDQLIMVIANASQRRCENMATIEGRKSVAQSRPRGQIPKRHRGHQIAGSPRRLTDLVTHSPA